MDYEHSAGAVIFHYGREVEYLILHYEEGHWDFPKGHVEAGENEMQAMMREVKEETGLDVDVVFGFRENVEYTFRAKYDNGRLKHKVVDFFFAESKTKSVVLSDEHIGYEWLPYELALEKLTYQSARSLLKKAHMFLKSVAKSKGGDGNGG